MSTAPVGQVGPIVVDVDGLPKSGVSSVVERLAYKLRSRGHEVISGWVDSIDHSSLVEFAGVVLIEGPGVPAALRKWRDGGLKTSGTVSFFIRTDDFNIRCRCGQPQVLMEYQDKPSPSAYPIDNNGDLLGTVNVMDLLLSTRVPSLAPGQVIIYAPSGTGKGQVISRLRQLLPNIQVSRSATTRQRRDGEGDESYDFVTHEQFQELIANGALAEYAQFAGNFYGSLRPPADTGWYLYEIELGGALQIIENVPGVRVIRLEPPGRSVAAQLSYLTQRINNDIKERNNIEGRLETAKKEFAGPANLIVVNSRIDEAARAIAWYI